MNKHYKFMIYVGQILSSRNFKEKRRLSLLEDAFSVTEEELNNKNAFTEKECALEFINWRTDLAEIDPFKNAPKWLTQETISNILF